VIDAVGRKEGGTNPANSKKKKKTNLGGPTPQGRKLQALWKTCSEKKESPKHSSTGVSKNIRGKKDEVLRGVILGQGELHPSKITTGVVGRGEK